MSINSSVLVGRLVSDPELRYTKQGTACCNFTLAVNDGWGDNQQTYYVDHVAWKNRAETIANHCKKGYQVGTKGKLTTRTYKNKEDKTVKVTEVLVEDIQFLYSKKSENNQSNKSNQSNDPFANDSRTIEISEDMLPF